MDPATLVGILLAFGSLYAMLTLEGAHVEALLLPAPMVLVFGATIAISIASTTLSDAMNAFKSLPRALRGKSVKPQLVIDEMVGLAETARRDGLLALDQQSDTVKDPFLKLALQNIADGTDAEELRILLDDVTTTTSKSSRSAGKFFMSMGGYAPTVGIIGTVVSLTHVLEKLDSPETLGPSIATAFVATLWGLLSANFLWLPLGGRLTKLAEVEQERMTLITEGMLEIQAGSQPRLLGERLRALVPGQAMAPTKSDKNEKAA
jgi:chemotaxis protein MotA